MELSLTRLNHAMSELVISLGLPVSIAETCVCIAFDYNNMHELLQDFQDECVPKNYDYEYAEWLERFWEYGVQQAISNYLYSCGIQNPQSTIQIINCLYAYFVPNCSYCGYQHSAMNVVRAVAYHDGYTQAQYWVCDSCVVHAHKNMNVGIGFCWCCGDQPHDIRDLNHQNECPIHYGESSYSEEELEDMESYIEYHTKDN